MGHIKSMFNFFTYFDRAKLQLILKNRKYRPSLSQCVELLFSLFRHQTVALVDTEWPMVGVEFHFLVRRPGLPYKASSSS